MTLDVVNSENEKIGSLDLSDAVFAGPIKHDLVWQSVVREQAAARRGTHAAKNRALVSGSGKKPWRQKGTGRARVGSSRTPLWRHGGTVFPPQPRSYAFTIPRKAERGALRAALQTRLGEQVVVVVDELKTAEKKTKLAAELFKRLGVTGPALVTDVAVDENFGYAVRNLPGVRVVPCGRLTARDVMAAARIVATRAALARLQEVLA